MKHGDIASADLNHGAGARIERDCRRRRLHSFRPILLTRLRLFRHPCHRLHFCHFLRRSLPPASPLLLPLPPASPLPVPLPPASPLPVPLPPASPLPVPCRQLRLCCCPCRQPRLYRCPCRQLRLCRCPCRQLRLYRSLRPFPFRSRCHRLCRSHLWQMRFATKFPAPNPSRLCATGSPRGRARSTRKEACERLCLILIDPPCIETDIAGSSLLPSRFPECAGYAYRPPTRADGRR